MAKISIIIPDEIKEKLDKEAMENDVKLSWVVRKALRQYVQGQENKEQIGD
mgnify:CR=1 FL=1